MGQAGGQQGQFGQGSPFTFTSHSFTEQHTQAREDQHGETIEGQTFESAEAQSPNNDIPGLPKNTIEGDFQRKD